MDYQNEERRKRRRLNKGNRSRSRSSSTSSSTASNGILCECGVPLKHKDKSVKKHVDSKAYQRHLRLKEIHTANPAPEAD